MPQFESSRLKIKRANKHIQELNALLDGFVNSDFYVVRVEHDAERRLNFVNFDIDTSGFPTDDMACAIGDALHNLRSTLDHMWFEAIGLCGGKTTKWTSFPVRDAGDELVNALNCALEKKQITVPVATLVLDSVQPYQRGDKTIWGLNELNVWDKHQMLVPVLKLMHFANVRLEDEKGRPAGRLFYYMDESSRVRVDPMKSTDDRILTVKDKGKPSATILFDVGVPFEGEAVIPTLNRIAEEVTRTLEAFEALSLGNEG